MVARPNLVGVRPVHRSSDQPLARRDGFYHGAIGVTTAADIIDRAVPRALDKVPESIDEIPGMDVVANLLPLVAEHRIGLPGNGAF